MIDWRPECTKQSWGTDAGEFTGGPTKVLLHSTETIGFPSYTKDGKAGMSAPHETWKWDPALLRFEKRQHIPHTLAARALVNLDGGVQTNRDSVHQVELVGYSDKQKCDSVGGRYLPGQGDAYLRELGREVRKLCADVDCSLNLYTPWVHYPDSYGATPTRMTPAEWDAFGGICGHQHAAENVHGDPGDLNVPRALLLSNPEDDMSAEDVKAINDYTRDFLWDGFTIGGVAHPGIGRVVESNQVRINNLATDHDALVKQVEALIAKVDQLATGSAPTAAAIADELAKRLEA